MEEFCARRAIPFETCGKVIVAVDASEVRGSRASSSEGERTASRAIWSGPSGCASSSPRRGARASRSGTGIIDYRAVCDRLARRIAEAGGRVVTCAKALDVAARSAEVTVRTTADEFESDFLINCAGLHSDRVLQQSGGVRPARIVPFRGEYWELAPAARSLIRNLIYPVPDPSFPFLGVHFTRTIEGGVECGPNAVLAFAREGYTKARGNAGDLWDVLSYRGFWKLARSTDARARRNVALLLERLSPARSSGSSQPCSRGPRASARRRPRASARSRRSARRRLPPPRRRPRRPRAERAVSRRDLVALHQEAIVDEIAARSG